MKKESRIPEGLSVQGPRLGHYYHDFRYELSIPRKMDGNGIPLWEYGVPIGSRYHPVLITAYSLALHEKHLHDRDDASRAHFFRLMDFLVEMQKQSRSGFGWEYDVPNYKFYGMPPWISAMSQGLGISALLRAYQIEPKSEYMECASRAMKAFELSCEAGGVRDMDAEGYTYFEEVPSTAPNQSKHILNGFLFALWGIYDYFRVTASESANMLFQAGVKTLKSTISRYDTGYWTLYCLGYRNYLADRFYHQVHIDGVKIFHEITGDPVFVQFADRWSAYQVSRISLCRWWVVYRYSRISHKVNRLRTFLKLL